MGSCAKCSTHAHTQRDARACVCRSDLVANGDAARRGAAGGGKVGTPRTGFSVSV